MTDLHVTYPSDDGHDEDLGSVPQLHILRDGQGDFYISVGGERPGWTSVRLCGPNGGGASQREPELYTAIAMATRALAGDLDGVRALARSLILEEIGALRRDVGRERAAKERAETELGKARKTIRENYRRHVEQRELLVGGSHAWCPICEVIVGPVNEQERERGARCCAGHELVYSADWRARAEAAERELAEIKASQVDPHDPENPDYQEFLEACAKDCRCDFPPCPGVTAGGLCDSWDASPGGFDDHEDGDDWSDMADEDSP